MFLKLISLVLLLMGKNYADCCPCTTHGAQEKVYITKNQKIQIKDPYFVLLKGVNNGAAYCTLAPKDLEENDSLESAEFVGSSIGKIELHTHIMEGDVAKMREVKNFIVDKNEGKVLEPGNDHIMLINVSSDFKENEISLILNFKNAGKVKVVFNRKEIKKSCCE